MTEAANRSEAPNIYREGAIFLAVGAVFATAGSLYLAAQQSFFGSQGDVEQLIWQARNLVHLLHTGDPIVRDAFYGTPTPYAYMPTSIGVGGFVALVRGATGSPWFAHNLGLSLGLVANFVAAYICFRKLEVDRKPEVPEREPELSHHERRNQ